MTQPTIVFDLDGTLIDTAPDLLASLNHCLAAEGMAPVQASELLRFVGMGARVMIQRAFAASQRDLDEATLARLMEVFLEHYATGMPGKSAPYPGLLCDPRPVRAERLCHGHLHQQAGAAVVDAARQARAQPAFCRHLRRRQLFCVPQAGPAPPRGDNSQGRRRPGAARSWSAIRAPTSTPPRPPASRWSPSIFGYTDRHVREFEALLISSRIMTS